MRKATKALSRTSLCEYALCGSPNGGGGGMLFSNLIVTTTPCLSR